MATWNSASGSQELSSSYENFCHTYLQVKFGLPLSDTLYNDDLPCQLVEMLVYIAHGGATTADIFRRPGSTGDVAAIVTDLAAGRMVDFTRYNFCTLASVAKKFLLRIPGGLFGADVENRLLGVLRLNSRAKKYEAINGIITHLPLPTQRLLSLLLGTWFRIVSHSEYNTMSSDAVAKNVATSVFHGVAGDVERLQSAVQVLQILIDDFSVVSMLGARNIQYFADVSRTRPSVEEKRRGNASASSTLCLMASSQCFGSATLNSSSVTPRVSLAAQSDAIVHVFPPTPSTPPAGRTPPSPHHESSLWAKQQMNPQSSASAPDVNKMLTSPSRSLLSSATMSSSLTRFDSVKRRQLMRMKMRSHWFLSPNANYRPEILRETTSLICMGDTKASSRPVAHNLSSESFNDAILLNINPKLHPDPAGLPKFLVPATEGAKPGPARAYSPRFPSMNGH